MWTMPIIRYDTGDIAELDPKPCACGRSLPTLRQIYGRAVDSVVLPDGSRLLWPFFHEVLGGYDELDQWRIIQDDERHLRVQLAFRNNTSLLHKIEADLCSALPTGIELTIERVDAIPAITGEKTRMIISNISASGKNES
jgi:phenylacetate-CoA ligase